MMQARKALKAYLSERGVTKEVRQSLFRKVTTYTSAGYQERLRLYAAEVAKEKGILKADIAIYKQRARIAGMSEETITRNLIFAAKQGKGPVAAFEKRMATVETAILRRETQEQALDGYKAVWGEDVPYEWITVSVNPCPDCKIRAGTILSLDKWEDIGTPGAGSTVCEANCMCQLMPYELAEEMFPDVKTFQWDKDSGVLTGKADMRTIEAGQED